LGHLVVVDVVGFLVVGIDQVLVAVVVDVVVHHVEVAEVVEERHFPVEVVKVD
jgi:hypothetical protein